MQTRSLAFDRPAKRVLQDRDTHYSIHHLERALQPGDSLRLTFDLTHRQRGLPNSAIPTDVAGNGSYFSWGWLPHIGYQPALELEGAKERLAHGLPAAPPLPSDADQTAITPDTLVREWRENGRRYFHYRTEVPLSFGCACSPPAPAGTASRWTSSRRR
ncbi:MAG TPA: hypothetical protein VF613_12275 [Longimicrobium sp.]|jgi:hypothetical protein